MSCSWVKKRLVRGHRCANWWDGDEAEPKRLYLGKANFPERARALQVEIGSQDLSPELVAPGFDWPDRASCSPSASSIRSVAVRPRAADRRANSGPRYGATATTTTQAGNVVRHSCDPACHQAEASVGVAGASRHGSAEAKLVEGSGARAKSVPMALSAAAGRLYLDGGSASGPPCADHWPDGGQQSQAEAEAVGMRAWCWRACHLHVLGGATD